MTDECLPIDTVEPEVGPKRVAFTPAVIEDLTDRQRHDLELGLQALSGTVLIRRWLDRELHVLKE